MKILHDLRRRRVFRLIGLYVVGAWVVIQVAEALFQAWGVPESAMRYVFIAAILCFPIALVFGWIYDITSKGIVRTRAAGPDETVDISLKRTDHVILSAMLVVGIVVLAGSADKVMDEIEQPVVSAIVERLENSIAVLPFSNLDMNADTGYFSDGITEEILHRLSTLRALHVLASNSSFALRNSTEGPAEIAAKLGVRYLLQGSVRREQNQVRITARLIDQTGLMIWSDTFDRELKGVFAIQSEIATTVSSEVLNEIVPLADLPEGRTTENMDAYNDYLVGRAFVNARTPGWQDKAETAFRRAIDRDEGFAPAHAGLAVSLYVARGAATRAEEAMEAAQRSLELDPELALGHAILGLITFEQTPELDEAEQLLKRAIELDPSLGHAYNWLAILYLDQGMTAEKDAIQDRGLAIDPLNPALAVNIANRESRKGDFRRAEQLMLRVANLPEPSGVAMFELHNLYFKWGRFDQSTHWAQEIVRGYAQTNNRIGFTSLAWAYERLGLSSDADHWIGVFMELVPQGPEPFLFSSYLKRIKGDYQGQQTAIEQLNENPLPAYFEQPGFIAAIFGVSHLFARDYEAGIEILESTFDVSFAEFARYMEDKDAIDITHTLAHAYEEVGRLDDSRRLLLELAAIIDPVDAQPIRFPPMLEDIALNRAMLGNIEGALDALQQAADLGWSNYFWATSDPAWNAAFSTPGFQKLLAEVRADLDRQRAVVEAADAQQDLRAEIELMFAK